MMRKGQQGIALLTVLLVMSLALLVTAGMLRSHRLALHSSAQQLHQLQLRQSAFAGEAWGRERLYTLLADPKLPRQTPTGVIAVDGAAGRCCARPAGDYATCRQSPATQGSSPAAR